MNASQAARVLNVSDKTLRRWLKEKKYGLTAIRDASNRLMLSESDIKRVQEERRWLPETFEAEQAIPAPELAARIERLERRLERLESAARREPATHTAPSLPRQPIEPLPPGAILAREFAARHGVNARTFRDHYAAGIGGEKAPVSARQKPNRPNEREYFLTEEQQRACLDFWRRHGVQFREPAEQGE